MWRGCQDGVRARSGSWRARAGSCIRASLLTVLFDSCRVPLTPEFLWAQWKDHVFITINVPNVRKSDATVRLTEDGGVYFRGFGGNVGAEAEYLLDIKLYAPILTAPESKCNITARHVAFRIVKTESGPYWPRLLKAEGRNVHCKIDWDNWRDEDEDNEDYKFTTNFDNSKDLQDMDFGSGASTSDEDDDGDEGPSLMETGVAPGAVASASTD